MQHFASLPLYPGGLFGMSLHAATTLSAGSGALFSRSLSTLAKALLGGHRPSTSTTGSAFVSAARARRGVLDAVWGMSGGMCADPISL